MPNDTTRKFFDARATDYYAVNYEVPRNRHAHNLALRRKACLELLAPVEGMVLDLGCGPGAMTVPLLEMKYQVVSTDISSAMVADVSRRSRELGVEPRVAVADAAALPFLDRSFDAVVTTGVLEYVPDMRRAMREIARVLRPGGVAVATMSLPRRFERLAVRALATLRGQSTQVRQYIHNRSDFDEIVASSGLKIEQRRCCSFAPFPLDAVWPDGVRWIDENFGASLNKVDVACALAKTYLVQARRSAR